MNVLFDRFNFLVDKLKESKIVLYGAGMGAQRAIDWLGETGILHNVEAIVDNDKEKHFKTYNYNNISLVILPIEQLLSFYDDDTFIIITNMHNDVINEINSSLLSYNIEEKSILSFERIIDCYAGIKIENVRKNNSHTKVRVGFVSYRIETWDKLEPIFAEMLKDERFEPFLFVLPQFDQLNGKVGDSVNIEPYKTGVADSNSIVPYITDNGDEINIEDFDLDYIFLSDPYDHFTPDQFKSDSLVNHVRICYMPYGFNSAYNFVKINTNRLFFRKVSIDFTPEKDAQNVIKEQLYLKDNKTIHQYYSLGYPSLEKYYKLKKRDSANILWTPRWTYDAEVGGSHFFEYKDSIFSLKDFCNNSEVSIRPHPLMFDNFINSGLMSEDEVKEYKDKLFVNDIGMDEFKDLYLSLSNTDILISDFSSILLPFFLTERPIIYCVADNIKPLETFDLIISGMYLAYDYEDIKKYVNMLINNQDPLYEKRKKIKDELKNLAIGSAEKITDAIYNDYVG